MSATAIVLLVGLFLIVFASGMMFDRALSRLVKRCPSTSPCRTGDWPLRARADTMKECARRALMPLSITDPTKSRALADAIKAYMEVRDEP